MDEYFPSDANEGSEQRRSQEELMAGFRLNPDEVVTFEPPNDPNIAVHAHQIGNGIKIPGVDVAELVIGGDNTNVRAQIIKTGEVGHPDNLRPEYIIVVPGAGPDGQPFAAKLEQGKFWGIGRGFESQRNLPDTVSGQHCSIGQDESGKLVVSNSQPTNSTWLRVHGRYN